MANLPDISDIIKAKEDAEEKYTKFKEEACNFIRFVDNQLDRVIVERYRAAGIGPNECNHPVAYLFTDSEMPTDTRYDTRCACCGYKWNSSLEEEKRLAECVRKCRLLDEAERECKI